MEGQPPAAEQDGRHIHRFAAQHKTFHNDRIPSGRNYAHRMIVDFHGATVQFGGFLYRDFNALLGLVIRVEQGDEFFVVVGQIALKLAGWPGRPFGVADFQNHRLADVAFEQGLVGVRYHAQKECFRLR